MQFFVQLSSTWALLSTNELFAMVKFLVRQWAVKCQLQRLLRVQPRVVNAWVNDVGVYPIPFTAAWVISITCHARPPHASSAGGAPSTGTRPYARRALFLFEINVRFPVVRRRSECNSSVTVGRLEVPSAGAIPGRSDSLKWPTESNVLVSRNADLSSDISVWCFFGLSPLTQEVVRSVPGTDSYTTNQPSATVYTW